MPRGLLESQGGAAHKGVVVPGHDSKVANGTGFGGYKEIKSRLLPKGNAIERHPLSQLSLGKALHIRGRRIGALIPPASDYRLQEILIRVICRLSEHCQVDQSQVLARVAEFQGAVAGIVLQGALLHVQCGQVLQLGVPLQCGHAIGLRQVLDFASSQQVAGGIVLVHYQIVKAREVYQLGASRTLLVELLGRERGESPLVLYSGNPKRE